MPNEIDVTNTDTGTPGARDSTMPPTAAISANTTDATIVVTGELKTRPAAAAPCAALPPPIANQLACCLYASGYAER